MHRLIATTFVPAITFVLGMGCSDDTTEPTQLPIDDAVATYAKIVKASYQDSVTTAETLDAAVATFSGAPTVANLEAARDAWMASREPYLQTEVYRFYDGPIDNADDGREGLLNAWPLDEAYIDYVQGDATAGIVNDDSVVIDGETLAELNEVGGEKNIATGYHAVEFLLWGQDMSADGPGARPASDYESTNPSAARRSQYLTTTSALLVDHLKEVDSAWNEDADYRVEFQASGEDGLRKILTGMIILSGFETGGERLQTALDSGDQEDEHSCFSDNTHRDMVQDIQGIQNVFLGEYKRTDGSMVTGTGVKAVIEQLDATLAADLEAKIAESLALAQALQPPFDQEIAPSNSAGRARVEALVVSLRQQEDLLEETFRRLGLDVPAAE